MRKKFIAFLIAAAFASGLLAGCGQGGEAAEAEAEEAGASEEEIEEEETEEEEEEEEPEAPEEEEAEAMEEEAEETALASPSVNGKLRVEGTQLTDEHGDPVQLRGISTHGLSWFPEYVNRECIADLHSWGANVIRLAMYTADYAGYCEGGDQEELKDLIREGVEDALDEDMYVIVDWHILNDNSPLTYQAEAEAFFDEMSAEFAGYGNVLYEICNEPNGGTGWSEIKAYAEDIIPIIRANDPDAVIIVGTPTWSQDVDAAAADPITDYDNIMYTLHFYAATHGDDLRAKMKAALDEGLPIFVTEFGICDASGNGAIDEDSADTWVELMDSCGVSYVMWNLSNKDESSSIILSSVDKTSGFTEDDLSQSGKWILRHLQAERDGVPLSELAEEEKAEESAAADENGFVVSSSLVNSWEADGESCYMYDVSVKNASGSAVSSWEVTLEFEGDIRVSDGWNGTYTAEGNNLIIRSADYNGSLADGESATDIGFILVY